MGLLDRKGNKSRRVARRAHALPNSRARFAWRSRQFLGVTLLLGGTLGVAYPLWWNHRSSSGASALLKTFHHQQTSKGVPIANSSAASCVGNSVSGILSIPALALVAPVEQGLSDAVLNVAVGHDPSTSWPNKSSAALFAAHDVSFFSQLGSIQEGNLVTYTSNCDTSEYRVSAISVLTTGSTVALPKNGSVILDTCYPSNALWYTSQRLVVTATFIKQVKQILPQNPAPLVSNVDHLVASVPTSIPPAELNLANNTQEMGHLSFSGNSSQAFIQSDLPLTAAAAALKGWFVVTHTLVGPQPSWWNSFTQAQFPASLVTASIRSTSPLEITENLNGANLTGVTLTGGLNNHIVTVDEVPNGNSLSVTGISWS